MLKVISEVQLRVTFECPECLILQTKIVTCIAQRSLQDIL